MRLVHLADLHLGYRQYQRLTPGGVNQREADVAATFRVSIDRIIALRPDVVVVAGDIFHSVRPTNQAILHAFLQFSRLVRQLPESKVLLVAGNHDTPRAAETGGILQLFAQLGLSVVDHEAQRLSFPERDLSILAVPGVPGLVRPTMLPDPDAKFNILVVHGPLVGMLPPWMTGRGTVEISPEELSAPRWDYVALGDYHVYQEIEPNAYYSGSLDYTSANTWGEKHEERERGILGKGFIERDLATGRHKFHALPPSRPLLDLGPISAAGLSTGDLNDRIRSLVERVEGGIDDKIIRLTIRDIERHVVRELDHKAIREYKRRALNFQLETLRPEATRTQSSGAPGRRPSLNEVVREKLATRPLDSDIDRTALIDRAMKYLDEAQAVAPTPALIES